MLTIALQSPLPPHPQEPRHYRDLTSPIMCVFFSVELLVVAVVVVRVPKPAAAAAAVLVHTTTGPATASKQILYNKTSGGSYHMGQHITFLALPLVSLSAPPLVIVPLFAQNFLLFSSQRGRQSVENYQRV